MVVFDLGVAAATFVVIFPTELPDRTLVATLVLAARFKPVPVWVAVAAAFFVQCLVAVLFGGLVSLLPRCPVLLVMGRRSRWVRCCCSGEPVRRCPTRCPTSRRPNGSARRLPFAVIRRVAGLLLAGLSVVTLIEAVRVG